MPQRGRVWLLLTGGLSLLAGLDGALLLLGLPAPVVSARLEDVHGPLLVVGFLGTLIAIERAVALGRPWGYSAPTLLGAGAVALVAPVPVSVGQALLVDGSVALCVVYAALWGRQHDDAVLVEGLAAMFAACASLLWTRLEVPVVLPWLVGFVVLTIAAERVELARLTLPTGAGIRLVVHACALLAATVTSLLWPEAGHRALGLAILALLWWLARHDVARRTIRGRGLPRFSAAALLLGYVWLGTAGVVWAVAGPPTATAAYDTVVHAVFLGFGMSMVMAHAPVILPAVLGRPLPYRPVLWAPLLLLHAGLALRVGVGDGLGVSRVWQVGSVLTVLALLAFVATAGALVVAGRPGPRAATDRPPATQSSSPVPSRESHRTSTVLARAPRRARTAPTTVSTRRRS